MGHQNMYTEVSENITLAHICEKTFTANHAKVSLPFLKIFVVFVTLIAVSCPM